MNTITPRPQQLSTAFRAVNKVSNSTQGGSDSTTKVSNSASDLGTNGRLGALDNRRQSVMPNSGGNESASSDGGSSTVEQSAVNTAIATDSSGIQASDSAIASGLDAAKATMKETLTNLASDPKAFHEAMQKAFGDSYDATKAETIRQQVMEGDFSWMPDIQVVDESVLADQSGTQGAGQALGAYSAENDTIYISAQLLESDPAKAAQILTEEVGHGLDARLNTSDAAGDEGDIFARIAGGEEISEAELTELRAENDSGTIVVDGKKVEVEYGFFSNPFKSIGKAFKSIGDGIKSAIKGVGKAFKSVINSPLFNKILFIAQFVPIPFVQVAVRVINVAKAAYQVVQGIKNGSIAGVLGGVAGVAGGVGKLGGMLGASTKFIDGAAKIANTAQTAAMAYQAMATGNFQAAAGLASNYFGGDTQVGRTIGAAGQAYSAVEQAKSGDYLGAIQTGRSAVQGFNASSSDGAATAQSDAASGVSAPRSGLMGFVDSVKGNATFQAIADNVSIIRDVVGLVKDGDYSAASQQFLANYADDLGIGADTQATINEWASVVESVVDTKEMIDNNNYAGAIENAAGMLGIPLSDNNRQRLGTVFALRDSVLGDRYADASRQAASLALQSGKPELAGTFLRLANMLEGKLPSPVILNTQSSAA